MGVGSSEAISSPGGAQRLIFKDPLHTEPTAYDILGLRDRNATNADVENAFAMAIANRGNVQKLTAARRTLQTRVNRTVVDLFYYDPKNLEKLQPNPLTDLNALALPNRAGTAESWKVQLRKRFPNLAAAHSLAVLWYWWALSEEERPNRAVRAKRLDEMWESTIACWAMLVSCNDFWVGLNLDPQDASGAQVALINRIAGQIHDLGLKHRNNGSPDAAQRFQELELALKTEMEVAKEIAEAGLQTNYGRTTCGLLMLQQLGMLSSAQQQVEAALGKSPSNEKLRKLRRILSPYFPIAILIDTNKPEAALAALDGKERTEIEQIAHALWEQGGRRSDGDKANWRQAEKDFQNRPEYGELRDLRGQALYLLGKQQASVNNIDEALTIWKKGLECKPSSDVAEKISREIVSVCHARAVGLAARQPDEAIALLEKALSLVDDVKLKLTLADTLVTRAIDRVNKLNEESNTASPTEAKRVMKQGLEDLERAAQLGSKRASEQAAVLKHMYEGAISAEVLRGAHEAAEREDWDGAVRQLREALRSASGSLAQTIRTNLAVALANRAMKTASRAAQIGNPAVNRRDELYQKLRGPHRLVSINNCAICDSYRGYGSSDWYTITLGDGTEATLCGSCATELREADKAASQPNPQVVEALRSAEKDLAESLDMDASGDGARQNLDDIRKILAQLTGQRAPGPRSSPAATRTTSPDLFSSYNPPATRTGPTGLDRFAKVILNWLFILFGVVMFDWKPGRVLGALCLGLVCLCLVLLGIRAIARRHSP